MKQWLFVFFYLTTVIQGLSQPLYFPPTVGNQWDTLLPASTNWCWTCLDTVDRYLSSKNTKGFLILKDGKIAYEKYYGSFTKDSLWYWASAGKTLTAFLIGIAQEKGLLNIQDKTAQYLGPGWTSLSQSREDSITIRHQLTMTSGLDDGVPDDNCTIDTCLKYKAPAGSRWAYHNAPYLLLQSVLDSCSALNLAQLTNQWVKFRIGMSGLWYDGIYYSRLRDMARFGLLNLARGTWNGTPILNDTTYFRQMTTPSQTINRSYGYLWWLNGQSSHMLPLTQFGFSGPLIPNAPADLIAGLGKNDQKIYVIPSMNMVVVRLGESSGLSMLALSSFDNELWGLLKPVFQPQVGVNQILPQSSIINMQSMSDGSFQWMLPEEWMNEKIEIVNMNGQMVKQVAIAKLRWKSEDWDLPKGCYLIKQGTQICKLLIP